MSSQYQYHADGSLRSAHDVLDERMDRAFSYDHVGRLQEAYTGSEARDYLNNSSSGMQTGPYRQTYQYSMWGELTTRTARFWSQVDNFTANYQNGRNQNPQWQYDAAGHVMKDETMWYTWDAAGRNREVLAIDHTRSSDQSHDGMGEVVKRVDNLHTEYGPYDITYYLRSSVLGGRVIMEIDSVGQKRKGYVYAAGNVLAEQVNNHVTWQHINPVTGSRGGSGETGDYLTTVEADPLGVNVGVEDPVIDPDPGGFEPEPEMAMLAGIGGSGCSSSNPYCKKCYLDGARMDCVQVAFLSEIGATVRCLNNDCGAHIQTVTAYGRDGRVLDSSSRIILPGEPGWDGSLDGRYRRGEVRSGDFSILWGGGIFNRVSGGGSSEVFFGHAGMQQTLQKTPLSTEELEILRKDLKNLLKDLDCANFIKAALEQLRKDTGRSQHNTINIEELFQAVIDGKGFQWVTTHPHLQASGGGGPGYAQINITQSGAFADFRGRHKNSSINRGGTIIHELFHVAGYGHDAMAQAMYNMGERFVGWSNWGGDFPDRNDAAFQGPKGAKWHDNALSGFFGNVLGQKCKIP